MLALANGLYAVAYGLFTRFFTEFVVESNIQAAGIGLKDLSGSQALLFDHYLNLTRSLGYLLVSLGVFVVYLALTRYRLGSRMAWLTYTTCGGVAWFGLLYSDLSIGSVLTIGLDGAGLATYLLAVFTPMKEVLSIRRGSSTGS